MVLCGAGLGQLQLTLAAHAAIVASGHAFTVGVGEQTIAQLRSARVKVTELDADVSGADTYLDGYLAVIDTVLDAAATAPPAVLLVPGNPLHDNSITRALVPLCRERDIKVEMHASVSPIDALINDLGVDVAGRGLQTFTAKTLLQRGVVPNPAVPLFVTGLDLFLDEQARPADTDAGQLFERLETHLARAYPPSHSITLVTRLTGRGVLTHRTSRLGDAHRLWSDAGPGSSLYVDPIRPRQTPNPKGSQP